MKTEIIEIEETKKFKPFKLEITFETYSEVESFCRSMKGLTNHTAHKVFYILADKIQNVEPS